MADSTIKKVTTLATAINGNSTLRLQLIYECEGGERNNGSSIWFEISRDHLPLLMAASDIAMKSSQGSLDLD